MKIVIYFKSSKPHRVELTHRWINQYLRKFTAAFNEATYMLKAYTSPKKEEVVIIDLNYDRNDVEHVYLVMDLKKELGGLLAEFTDAFKMGYDDTGIIQL